MIESRFINTRIKLYFDRHYLMLSAFETAHGDGLLQLAIFILQGLKEALPLRSHPRFQRYSDSGKLSLCK
jgi:hypothetical protein